MRARKLSPRDPVLADDLAQAGRIALWVANPSRYSAADARYLQAILHLAIRNELRSQRRAARSSTYSLFDFFAESELPSSEMPPVECKRRATGPWPLEFWLPVIGQGAHHVWI